MGERRSIRNARRGGLFGWIILGFLALFVVVPLVIWGALALLGHAPTGMMYAPVGFWFFPLGFLFVIFLVFFAIRLAFWGPRWGWYGHRHGPWGPMGFAHSEPEDVVRHRYASGEITREQYDTMMRDLRSHT
jgi:putative membrane protein